MPHPNDLILESRTHLKSLGYTLVNLPDPSRKGPAHDAIVVEKNCVGSLLLVTLVDDDHPHHATPKEQAEQYILQNHQRATHAAVILVTGLPWAITYP